jgi:hypothetical protein
MIADKMIFKCSKSIKIKRRLIIYFVLYIGENIYNSYNKTDGKISIIAKILVKSGEKYNSSMHNLTATAKFVIFVD